MNCSMRACEAQRGLSPAFTCFSYGLRLNIGFEAVVSCRMFDLLVYQ